MKKIIVLALAIVCGAAMSTSFAKKPKKAAEPVQKVDPMQAKIDSLKKVRELRELERAMEIEDLQHAQAVHAAQAAGTEVNIPCIESSFDDETYFRDLGIGANNNKQSARLDAVNAAKAMIKARLGEFVQGVTSNYFNSHAGTKPSDDVQRKMESKLNGVVERMLNDADHECEKQIVTPKGNLEWYYVIRIPKGDLKKQMTDAIANEENLKIDFNEFQMQKFMDEKMEDMLEAKKKAGY